MLNLIEETIIFLTDVSAPAAQAGKKGDVRIVGRNISNFAADWLLQGGQIRRIRKDQVQEVLIELGLAEPESTKETKPKSATQIADKTQRRTYGPGKNSRQIHTGIEGPAGADSSTNQGSDNKVED